MNTFRHADLCRCSRIALLLGLLMVTVGVGAAPGDLDTTFSEDGKASIHVGPPFGGERAQSVLVQADGKILLSGYVNPSHGLVRYGSDGSLDTSFGLNGKVLPPFGLAPDAGIGIVIQSDGSILQAGTGFSLVRYDSNGRLDRSFGGTGRVATQVGTVGDIALDVAIQADGKIVLAGYSQANVNQNYDQTFALVRYNADGSLDTTFSGDGKLLTDLGDRIDRCSDLAMQSDGKIVAAGYSGNFWALVRYNANGSLDTSFGEGGKLRMPGNYGGLGDVIVQQDGKILLAGNDSAGRITLSRFDTNGVLDGTFGIGGKVSTQVEGARNACLSLALQPNGKILAGGLVTDNQSIGSDFLLIRYLDTGDMDPAFGADGVVRTRVGSMDNIIYGLALQTDGKILAAGQVSSGPYSDFGVARFEGDTAPVITSHPASQTVTVGGTVSFTVAASGTPPLFYAWRLNGTDLVGANAATITLTNVHTGNAGTYSVVVSNHSGSVTSSTAVLRVNQPPIADAGATRRVAITANGSNATVVLDGGLSSDPDGDPLEFAWFTNASGPPIASGVVAAVTLPLGTNIIRLEVSDGLATDIDVATVAIVTPADAVRSLQADLEGAGLGRILTLLLQVDLRLAERWFERGYPFAGIIQLKRFQRKVSLFVERRDPELAASWIAQAQFIIDAVTSGAGEGTALEQLLALSREAEMPASLRVALVKWAESALAHRGNPDAVISQLEQFRTASRAGLASSDPELLDVLDAVAREAIEDQRASRGRLRLGLNLETGRMRLQISGSPGSTYRIEASTNLVNWEMIEASLQNVSREFEYEDPHSGQFPTRFYRLILP